MLSLNSALIDALEAGTGTPIFKMELLHYNGSAWVILGEYQVIQATLTRMKYDIYVQEDLLSVVTQIVDSDYAIDVIRGLTVGGTDYTITSNNYFIVDITYSEYYKGTHIVAELLPSVSVSAVSVNQISQNMYNDIFAQLNNTYLGWDASRDIWYNWESPNDPGTTWSLVDARQLITETYNRFFSYIFPRWFKTILIYGVASNFDNAEDGNYTPFAHAKVTKFLWPDKTINITWQSESGTQTYAADGQTAKSVSIGKINDANDPSADTSFQEWGRVFNGVCYQYVQRPDLNLEQGDLVKVSTDGFTAVRCLEQMEFYKVGSSPRWVQVVRQLPYHPHLAYIEDWIDWYNTTPESIGGGVPDSYFAGTGISTSGTNNRAASKIPNARDIKVNSEWFTNVLDLDDSDVETALKAIDDAIITDHGSLGGLSDDDHTQYIKHSLATAVSDFLVASAAGTFGKKTLAEVITLLGIITDHGALAGLSDDDHTQYIKHALATAANDFLIASGSGAFVKNTLAQTKTVLGLPEDHGALGGLGDDDHTQYIKHALATAANDFLVASGSGAFVKKTLAETRTILGGLLSGSSFPGSPSSGDTYFRTDLGLIFYYTGSQWRSTHQHFYGGQYYLTAVSAAVKAMRTDMEYNLSKIILRTYPASVNNASNYWTIKVYSKNLADSSTTTHYQTDTKTDTDDAFTSREVAPTTASPGTNDSHLWISFTPTGSPGLLHIDFDIYYYWVAT